MNRVPHLHDSFIVVKVGIVRRTTAFLHPPQNFVILSAAKNPRISLLPLPLRLFVLYGHLTSEVSS
jgi:hypothetical protein